MSGSQVPIELANVLVPAGPRRRASCLRCIRQFKLTFLVRHSAPLTDSPPRVSNDDQLIHCNRGYQESAI